MQTEAFALSLALTTNLENFIEYNSLLESLKCIINTSWA